MGFRFINPRPLGLLVPPVLLSAITALLWLLSLEEILRYERQAVLEGEVWRMVSANFVHLGWEHLLLNLAGLWLIWALVGKTLTAANWLIVTTICSFSVTGGLLLTQPDLAWYVGLSGLLHGYLIAGALMLLASGPRLALALLAIVTLKIIMEVTGEMSDSVAGLIGGKVIYLSHFYGALGGVLSWLGLFILPPPVKLTNGKRRP